MEENDAAGFKKIGIIGTGTRGSLNLGTKIAENARLYKIAVTGLYDKFEEQAQFSRKQMIEEYARHDLSVDIRVFSSYKELIECPEIDLVLITTPQYWRKEPVLHAIDRKKLVYCDKPLAHTLEDAQIIHDKWVENNKRGVLFGFTRRYENSWKRADEIVRQGWIGDVKMILLRSIIPYQRYMQGWWRLKKYSGDILNEKSSHHFDVINWFSGSTIDIISAMGGRSIFLPEENAPYRCLECARDCPYRRDMNPKGDQASLFQFPDYLKDTTEDLLIPDRCVYNEENDIIDHAIVNMGYTNGVKGQLVLNIGGFHTDDQETLEVIGTRGKLYLQRHPATIHVDYHYGKEHMNIDARDSRHHSSHFGADYVLVKQIADILHRQAEPPVGLHEGYMATKMAHYAAQSIVTNKVYHVD